MGLIFECDFLLNTDARSVLASCDWASLVADTPFFESARSDRFGRALLDSYRSNRPCDEVFRQLERCRVTAKPIATVVGLYQASRWVQTPQGFIDQDRQCFDVILIDVDALDREVSHWQQPLLTNCGDSTVVLYCQMRANELQFLLRISNEIGFKESCQWGPSVNSQVDAKSHPLLDPVIWQRGQVRAEVRQSDEGGRFFQSVVHYALIEMPSDIELPSDEQNCWVTLGQIKEILNRSSYTNNELRSVLSLVLRWL